AEMVMGVPQAVPGVRFALAVSQLLVHGEGRAAVADGLRVLAQQGMEPADRVESVGLPERLAGGPEPIQGLPSMAECSAIVALLFEDKSKLVMRTRLFNHVAKRLEQVEGAQEMAACCVVVVQASVCAAEEPMTVC